MSAHRRAFIYLFIFALEFLRIGVCGGGGREEGGGVKHKSMAVPVVR